MDFRIILFVSLFGRLESPRTIRKVLGGSLLRYDCHRQSFIFLIRCALLHSPERKYGIPLAITKPLTKMRPACRRVTLPIEIRLVRIRMFTRRGDH